MDDGFCGVRGPAGNRLFFGVVGVLGIGRTALESRARSYGDNRVAPSVWRCFRGGVRRVA